MTRGNVPITVQRLLGFVFVVSCGLSWVSFRLNDFDSQIWPLIFAIPLLFVFFLKGVKRILVLFLIYVSFSPVLVGVLFVIFKGHSLDLPFWRALLSYFSFAIVFTTYGACVYKIPRDDRVTALVFVNVIWLIAGLIQIVYGAYALESLVAVRTSPDRGVTGLSPEPTYYGVFLFCISWLILYERDYQVSRFLSLLLLSNVMFIFLVAKSSMVALFVLWALIVFAVLAFQRSVVFIVPVAALVLFAIQLSGFLEGTRLALLSASAFDPLSIVKTDASVNLRVGSAVAPFFGFLERGGFPGGFWDFDQLYDKMKAVSGGFFWYGTPVKIMSFIGAPLYELGFLFLPFLFVLFYTFADGTRRGVAEAAVIFPLLISAIPLAFPVLTMLLAHMSCRRLGLLGSAGAADLDDVW